MIAICVMTYGDHDEVLRVRPRHRQYLHGLLEQRRLIAAGSLVPDDDGGVFLYAVETLAEAEDLVRGDPYVVDGACASYWVREYETHGVNPDLLTVTG